MESSDQPATAPVEGRAEPDNSNHSRKAFVMPPQDAPLPAEDLEIAARAVCAWGGGFNVESARVALLDFLIQQPALRPHVVAFTTHWENQFEPMFADDAAAAAAKKKPRIEKRAFASMRPHKCIAEPIASEHEAAVAKRVLTQLGLTPESNRTWHVCLQDGPDGEHIPIGNFSTLRNAVSALIAVLCDEDENEVPDAESGSIMELFAYAWGWNTDCDGFQLHVTSHAEGCVAWT
jgi:hypothetical protein